MFGELLTTDEMAEATGPTAWVRAMADAEAALAEASAACGLIPEPAAEAILAACRELTVDPAQLGRAARAGGNPVIALVGCLRDRLDRPASDWVHFGATSQDILDTAAALVATRAGLLVDDHLGALAAACATVADRHRHSIMLARTLLQPALPTTFGARAAGWLLGVLEARRLVAGAIRHLPASLGGAAGTLAALGDHGPAVVATFARLLELKEPLMPWHTARQPVAAVGSALAIATATAAKVTGDIALGMQAEVGEMAEPAPGGSSSLPHKRNPVAATLTNAASRRATALAGVLIGSVVAEHERPAGAWHAEWAAWAELLALAGSAAARAAATVDGLVVDTEQMAANVDRSGPSLLSERVVAALLPNVGRATALAAVGDAAQRSDMARTLASDPRVGLDPGQVAALLDPTTYLGATEVWIDRVLAAYQEGRHDEQSSFPDGPGHR